MDQKRQEQNIPLEVLLKWFEARRDAEGLSPEEILERIEKIDALVRVIESRQMLSVDELRRMFEA